MLRDAIRSLIAMLVFTIICGAAYPAVVWAIGQGAFQHQANGSIVKVNGKDVGSSMIGQTFTTARYFHPRPTALAVNGKEFYDASTSGGSNLGPNSKVLAGIVAQRLKAVEKAYGVTAKQVPADMVTASFSGLDPDISVQNARIQAPVVASARGIAVSKVLDLIRTRTDHPTLGFLGTTRVNVLDLNLALDRLKGS
ncbi:MAG TPA: potassium-transporting ATPase subunit KdpC [Caldimonas sp.]|nr:potassium-transporting ATPase subunit KdpC [Caldimonas sp.]HEV7577637.1 potassium-transporting ATPase subunit KdpC [Caldimonas sp.]